MAIATLKAGGHFGEMGLVDQAPRSATVTALEETSAVSIDRTGCSSCCVGTRCSREAPVELVQCC